VGKSDQKVKIRLINVIGYSGSGKTQFIINAIELLKKTLNYEVAVIKNIDEHQIDKESKDSYKFSKAGASFSITKNINDETTIFIKKELSIKKLTKWMESGPFNIDLIFTEGFRTLEVPTVLCVKNVKELKPQFNNYITMISGIICSTSYPKSIVVDDKLEIQIIDIQENYNIFIKLFNLS